MAAPMYRLLVAGDSAVGKSALTIRFSTGQFVAEYDPTIEDSRRKQIMLESKPVVLDVLDTAGREEFSFKRGWAAQLKSDCWILVFDVTRVETLRFALKLVDELQEVHNGKPLGPVFLVGNKLDLEAQRVVAAKEAERMAKQKSVSYLETSAKTDANVTKLFESAARAVAALNGATGREKKPPLEELQE